MLHSLFSGIKTVLAIGAHPDDIEIGCGGTFLRLLAESEIDVHWVVIGSTDARRAEGFAGAEKFLRRARSKRVDIENYPDSLFPSVYSELKEYFRQLQTGVSPDLIFTHRLEDRHQDHRLVSELTWNTFRDHLILEYEIPKYEGDLGQPNIYVPLTKEQQEAKIRSLLEAFPSQQDKSWFNANSLSALPLLRGIEAGPHADYAEAFHCRKLVL